MRTKIIYGIIAVLLIFAGAWYFTQQNTAGVAKPEKKEAINIKIGYLPIVNALPLYVAIEKNYFKEVGLQIEPVKFEAPNLQVDALIAGNIDFGAPSTAMGITAISRAKNPDTLKIFALSGDTNPDHIGNVLLVKSGNTLSSIKELKDKKLGILPGIQFRTIAKHILKQEDLEIDQGVTIIELALPLQLQALQTGQVDAILTLEPVKTIGITQSIVEDLVSGPMLKYVADPWFGGGGVVNVKFARENPDITKKVMAIFDKAIKEINADPSKARVYLSKYTPLKGEALNTVPFPVWKMYTDFNKNDVNALQKFFDIFALYKVIDKKVSAPALIYQE